MKRLKVHTDDSNHQTLGDFTKAVLRNQIQFQPEFLMSHLSPSAKETMIRYFMTHREDTLLPRSKFADPHTVQSLFMFHSLWLGAGFSANEW